MKKKRKSRGFITVFVTLMMVPVVVCTGTMVDVARLKLYSSQGAMAADAYGEVVLSEYDNLLKELYGLFSVTQNENGLKSIEEFQNYIGYSFVPNEDGTNVSGFMPYENAEINVSYEKVESASLSNNNVLLTQIDDFMKFRIVEEITGERDILEILEKFDKMSADMDVVNERNKITNNGSKALKRIGFYFESLEKLNDYPEYLKERQKYFAGFSKTLKEIYESEEYQKYVNYIDNKEKIDAAKDRVDNHENEGEIEETSEEKENDSELAKQYVDVEKYKTEIEDKLSFWEEGMDKTSYKIVFGEAEKRLGELDFYANSLNEILTTLEQQIATLRSKLNSCSQDVKGDIEEEIKGLEKITDMASDFKETVDLLFQHTVSEKDKENKKDWKKEKEKLYKIKSNILAGTQEGSDWKSEIDFEWYDFQEAKSAFYHELEELCKGKDGTGGNKAAADEKIDHAEKIQNNAQKELEGDEETDARDISENLAVQLKVPGSSAQVPGITECFSGGASFASIGNGLVGKFLLTTYDFGMFSSRVSGVKTLTESNGEKVSVAENSENKYYDVSLTDIEMSKDVNYLYGAELEYLIGGRNESVENLNYTRNVICGVRMTTNYLSSYSINKVNSTIKKIADAAAKAVVTASGGTAAAAAPLIRVAVSGALRLAFSTLETVNDWKLLKEREDVIFYKRELGDLTTSSEILQNLLGENVSGSSESDEIKLSYEDYMYVLMCLFIDKNTLLDRTSNLITLNVNQSQNNGDALGTLQFKMENTVTAVKSTCKINEKFLIVPKKFVDMYISGTYTETIIQKLDDGSYGYSVIRGY